MSDAPPTQIDPIGEAVGEMVENIVNSPVPPVTSQEEGAAAGSPAPAVRSADLTAGKPVANADGSVRRKRGRPSKAELAARAAGDGVNVERSVVTPSPSAPAVPSPAGLVIPPDPSSPDAAMVAAAAEADARRKAVERSAKVGARVTVVALRRIAAMVAGEPVPFDKTSDFNEREEIEEAVRSQIVESQIGFVPAEAELLVLVGSYLAKATQTEKGKGNVQKMREWAAGRVAALVGWFRRKKANG